MEELKLGTFIKTLRKEKQLTQKELTEKLNVSDKAISKWELGDSNPDLLLLGKIANLFSISIDELYCGKRIKPLKKDKYLKLFYLNIIFLILLFIFSIINTIIINGTKTAFLMIKIDHNGSVAMTNIYIINLFILFFLVIDIIFFIKNKFKR